MADSAASISWLKATAAVVLRSAARVHSFEPGPNLGGPCRFSVGVDLALETLNQLARKGGSLFVGKQ